MIQYVIGPSDFYFEDGQFDSRGGILSIYVFFSCHISFFTVVFLLLVNYTLAFVAFPVLNTKLREAY
jgi:hypothetical protein